ncbi:MAG: DUF3570 domain-containing protein [Opitutaceae bacterium]
MTPRGTRAEDALSYKYEDYRETDGRIAVTTHSVFASQDLGTDTHLTAEGVIDAIAGATPNGEPAPAGSDQVPLSEMHDRRKAWNTTLSHQFPRLNVSLGYAHSLESDYLSNGYSLNTTTDFNEKNTTLLVGIAGTDDRVKVFYQPDWVSKRTYDAIVGISQVLDPQTTISFNISTDRARGYLSDPYKLVLKTVEVFPGVFLPVTSAENRPAERRKWVAYATVNHAFVALHAALEGSYRFYHDTYGMNAHTVSVSWIQRLGPHLRLEPALRFYDQNAADFYHYNLDQTTIEPVAGPPQTQGPFYSSDYRLSAMRTTSTAMKAVWTVRPWLELNVAYERYDMRGKDGVTPQSAFAHANILTAGTQFSW